ncbi:MAG: choice-of-anchor Q domain-containing protein [Pyrinomonadaceae bacterium]
MREAIQATNNIPTDDTILFSITGRIELTSALPAITGGDHRTRRNHADGGASLSSTFRIFTVTATEDNGGPTHTIALLSTSPAIDKGLTGPFTTDQRGAGFTRTFDDPVVVPATGGDNTDFGAFELQPPRINPGNALLINESCQPANGAIDSGERITVNLELMNASSAPTSNLVATLQSSGGVVAPSAPRSYGTIAVNSSAARDFSFTAAGSLVSGQTITATLQLQDGSSNLGTVSFNFTVGPTPCAFVRLVVTSAPSRADASTVVGAITVQNIGSLPANDVTLTTAKLGTTNGTPLPQSLGTLAPGASASVSVNFNNSTPGISSVLAVGGTYSGGTFSSSKRVTIP